MIFQLTLVFTSLAVFPVIGLSLVETPEDFVNPDRGYYEPRGGTVQRNNTNFWWNTVNSLKAYPLLHLRYDLSPFSSNADGESTPISERALAYLSSVFATIREAGGTSIVRFSYDINGIGGNREPDMDMVEKHISQLGTLISQNLDVVAAVETGMFGLYGEQWGSTLSGPAHMMYRLVEAWLNAVPASRTVSVRRPIFYLRWLNEKFDLQIPVNNITANYGVVYANGESEKGGFTSAYRVGVYNDGYLGSGNDLGTYSSRSREVPWVGMQASHTLYGGETVQNDVKVGDTKPVIGPYNCIEFIDTEAFITHTSYLSQIWSDKVMKEWKAQTYPGPDPVWKDNASVFTYIGAHLGYRFVLRETQLTVTGAATGEGGEEVTADTATTTVAAEFITKAEAVKKTGKKKEAERETKKITKTLIGRGGERKRKRRAFTSGFTKTGIKTETETGAGTEARRMLMIKGKLENVGFGNVVNEKIVYVLLEKFVEDEGEGGGLGSSTNSHTKTRTRLSADTDARTNTTTNTETAAGSNKKKTNDNICEQPLLYRIKTRGLDIRKLYSKETADYTIKLVLPQPQSQIQRTPQSSSSTQTQSQRHVQAQMASTFTTTHTTSTTAPTAAGKHIAAAEGGGGGGVTAVAAGTYRVYVQIGDREERASTNMALRKIRFANAGVWNAALGGNYVGDVIITGALGGGEEGEGEEGEGEGGEGGDTEGEESLCGKVSLSLDGCAALSSDCQFDSQQNYPCLQDSSLSGSGTSSSTYIDPTARPTIPVTLASTDKLQYEFYFAKTGVDGSANLTVYDVDGGGGEGSGLGTGTGVAFKAEWGADAGRFHVGVAVLWRGTADGNNHNNSSSDGIDFTKVYEGAAVEYAYTRTRLGVPTDGILGQSYIGVYASSVVSTGIEGEGEVGRDDEEEGGGGGDRAVANVVVKDYFIVDDWLGNSILLDNAPPGSMTICPPTNTTATTGAGEEEEEEEEEEVKECEEVGNPYMLDGGVYKVYIMRKKKRLVSVRQTPRMCGRVSLSEHMERWGKEDIGVVVHNVAEVGLRLSTNGGGQAGWIDYTYAVVEARHIPAAVETPHIPSPYHSSKSKLLIVIIAAAAGGFVVIVMVLVIVVCIVRKRKQKKNSEEKDARGNSDHTLRQRQDELKSIYGD